MGHHRMSAKRLRKLLMSFGYDRDRARLLVHIAWLLGYSYAEAWADIQAGDF